MTKLKIISNHTKYQKDQIINLEDKEAIPLLTSGKAIKIHRKTEEKTKEIKKNK
jgi:hypothetical protein